MHRVPKLVAVVALVTLASGACGYALAGRGNTLPADVRIIAVPTFDNQTTVAGVEQAVQDAVLAEFANRGSLRSQPEEAASDAVLRGTMTSLVVRPTALSDSGSVQATRQEMVLTVSLEFVNLRDNSTVLWRNPSLTIIEEFDVPPGNTTADPAAFFRQDSNAIERLARNLARTVVTSILEAF